ncbi:MAG: hypothetical protein JO111_09065 [Caulobacteraceae bacterium]|nr:hypothetical protein [Caulobacteraceae bacterium]
MFGDLESRISALEQIIIIIIIGGRGGWGGGPPRGDPGPTDFTRLSALANLVRQRGDPPAADIARLSLEAVETALLEVNAELTRLRGLEDELKKRLDEHRGGGRK